MAVHPGGWNANFMLATNSRQPFVLEGYGAIHERPGRRRPAGTPRSRSTGSRRRTSASPIGPQYIGRFEPETQWVGRFNDPLMTPTFGAPLCLRPHRPEDRLRRDPAELDLHAAAVAPGLSPAVHRRRRATTGSRSWPSPGPMTTTSIGDRALRPSIHADGAYDDRPGRRRPGLRLRLRQPRLQHEIAPRDRRPALGISAGFALYFVWTQNRADYADPGTLNLRRDMADLLTAPGRQYLHAEILLPLEHVRFRWHERGRGFVSSPDFWYDFDGQGVKRT